MEEYFEEPEEAELSEYDDAAETGIIKILTQEGVAYRNEFHYRLEDAMKYELGIKEIFHERTDAAIKRLVSAGRIKETRPLGRPSITRKNPPLFYRFPTIPLFRPLHDEMIRKTKCLDMISAMSSGMGYYAQDLWLHALDNIGFSIKYTNTNEYNGKKARTSGNIDMIAEIGDMTFGIDIKNGMAYPNDIRDKFMIACELDLYPLIIARIISYKDRMWLYENGGLFKLYMHSIYDIRFKNTYEQCSERLGYPFIFTDKIDNHVLAHLMGIIEDWCPKKDELDFKLERFKRSNFEI